MELQIKGVEELRRKLRLLPDRLADKAMRRALFRGAKVIRDAARANAARFDDRLTNESIQKNVVVQRANRRNEQSKGGPMQRIGVLGGARQYANTKANRRAGRVGQSYKTGGDKGNPGGDTWYWRFLEFGTSKMPARPFLRSAAVSSADRAMAAVTSAMLSEVDKEVRKL